MHGLERSIELLKSARSIEGASSILRELGFTAPPLPLDRRARNTLELPESFRLAVITQGEDSLRGLALESEDVSELRSLLSSVAIALSRNAPQFLWIVCIIRPTTGELAVACWSSARARTRIASLVCNTDRIYTSDAETLCALASIHGETDMLTHAGWLDVLGREAITRRFFAALQGVVAELGDSLNGRLPREERAELALLYISRLVFLAFLETRGWLNRDFGFLGSGYSRCIAEGGRYQQKVLEPLFFGTLNTPVRARSRRARAFGQIPFLNGGLFARSHLEKRRRSSVFADESFGNAYGSLLSHYRFSGREDSATWSEASIDPEILGKTFEALMAAQDRKSSGAFYTPQDLVEELARHALASIPEGGGRLESLRRIRILDPACGSGAFLVHMLDRIAALRKECGETGSRADVRRRVLQSSIFGVDLNPMAVWLCELRLWLSIVIESDDVDPMRLAPLPNLDRHIRVGDSLAGGSFDDRSVPIAGKKVLPLRGRYMRAVGPRKHTLARTLDRLERSAAIDVLVRRRAGLTADRREILLALRARDLFGHRHGPTTETRLHLLAIRARLKEITQRTKALHAGAALPFSFAAHYADVAAEGGFDVIVGNPPWVRVHHIAEASRERLRRDFTVYRNAAWEHGAAMAGAGRGFAAQVDVAALFVERTCELLRPGGTMALLLPTKLWRSLAGGGVRQFLLDRMNVAVLEDLAESHSQFDAAVYPSLLVARRRHRDAGNASDLIAAVRTRAGVVRWRSRHEALSIDCTPGSPWVLIPPRARDAFDTLSRAGVPFFSTEFGRPLLGVKTGCNRAYIVRVDSIDGDLARISGGGRIGLIEREMLRPLIRGETLDKWTLAGAREYLVWPHDEHDRPRRQLPPNARRWLLPFHDVLSARTDLHGRIPWWSVFRTESASHRLPRVISADFGLTPRAMVVEAGEPFVALNSCYVVQCPTSADAYALSALINSRLTAAWLNSIAEPARGGYRRYLGWTLSLLPVPADWNRARTYLAPLCERAMRGDVPAEEEMLRAVLDAYRLDFADVQHLLSWTADCD